MHVRAEAHCDPGNTVGQVGVHELLGHGSGKVIHRDTSDAVAMVSAEMPHPLTGEPITGSLPCPAAPATAGVAPSCA